MKKQILIAMVLALVAVLLGAILPATAADGTWNSDSSGNWGDTSKWSGGIVADGAGFTATFDDVITANRFVTNEIDRTIGHISFLDTSHSLTISGSNTLTLDDPSGTSVVYNAQGLTLSTPIAGASALSKTGPGQLTMQTAGVTNTYTGGTVVNEGTVSIIYDYNLGDPAGSIIMNGGTLNVNNGTYSMIRPVILLGATNVILKGGNGGWNCNGPVSGPGGIWLDCNGSGTHNINFNNLTNTFTGFLAIDALGDSRVNISIASLVDSSGAGNITYVTPKSGPNTPTLTWGSTATNALVLNNRRIELAGNSWPIPQMLQNANASHPIIINTDFLVTGSGYKPFKFDANKAGVTNVIAGDITDGTNGAVVAFELSGAGDLVLSGNNTYSGTNTFSGSGTLFLAGEASLPDDGTLNITGSGKVHVDTREKVGALLTNGVPTSPSTGIWGSSASGAANTNDTYFSGTGVLYVGLNFPPQGTVIMIK